MDEHIKEFIKLHPNLETIAQRIAQYQKNPLAKLYDLPLEELPNKIQQGNSTYSKLANFIIKKRLQDG